MLPFIRNNNKTELITSVLCLFRRRRGNLWLFLAVIVPVVLLTSNQLNASMILNDHQSDSNNFADHYSSYDELPDSPGLSRAHESPSWSITIQHFSYSEDTSSIKQQRFDFELFYSDYLFVNLVNRTIKEVNKLLDSISQASQGFEIVELVFLNRDLYEIHVESGNKDTEIYDHEEIVLVFDSREEINYTLVIKEPVNFHFFYVDPSGGIKNLRIIQQHIGRVIENNSPFLIYYNSTSGGMIIKSRDELMEFYNRLFVSITQSPFPREEFMRVTAALRGYLPDDIYKMNLITSFYVGEISYTHLMEGFIEPLFEDYLNNLGFRNISASIYTDFNVRRKRPGYEYVNIFQQ